MPKRRVPNDATARPLALLADRVQVVAVREGRAALIRVLGLTLMVLIGCGCDNDLRVKPQERPPVVHGLPPYGSPLWAPDGLTLYFNHRPLKRIFEDPPGSRDYRYEFFDSLAGFYRVDLSGQSMRRISGHSLPSPALAPDGRAVYYEFQGQVWKASMEGDTLNFGSAVQVTYDPAGAFGPSVSPDGARLLYYTSATSPTTGVYITSVLGGLGRRIGEIGWWFPSWAPDGERFVFVGRGPLISGIGAADTSGVGTLLLRSEGTDPRWAPNGQRIGYLSRGSSPTTPHNLWVMAADGSQPHQLTGGGVKAEYSWSPGGQEIVYVQFSTADTSWANGTIWTIDVTTLQRRQVTFNTPP